MAFPNERKTLAFWYDGKNSVIPRKLGSLKKKKKRFRRVDSDGVGRPHLGRPFDLALGLFGRALLFGRRLFEFVELLVALVRRLLASLVVILI